MQSVVFSVWLEIRKADKPERKSKNSARLIIFGPGPEPIFIQSKMLLFIERERVPTFIYSIRQMSKGKMFF